MTEYSYHPEGRGRLSTVGRSPLAWEVGKGLWEFDVIVAKVILNITIVLVLLVLFLCDKQCESETQPHVGGHWDSLKGLCPVASFSRWLQILPSSPSNHVNMELTTSTWVFWHCARVHVISSCGSSVVEAWQRWWLQSFQAFWLCSVGLVYSIHLIFFVHQAVLWSVCNMSSCAGQLLTE